MEVRSYFELDFFLFLNFQVCTLVVLRPGDSLYMADPCLVAMVPGFLVDMGVVEMLRVACCHSALGFEAAPYLETEGDRVMVIVAYQMFEAAQFLVVVVYCALLVI